SPYTTLFRALVPPLSRQREAVGPREIVPPAGEQLAAGIIHQHVVARFIGEQQQAPTAVLHHFVAVVYRVFAVIQHTPAFYLFIGHPVVSVYGFRCTEGVERRCGSQRCGGGCRLGKEGSSVHNEGACGDKFKKKIYPWCAIRAIGSKNTLIQKSEEP